MHIDYKGIQVPEELGELIPHMLDLEMVREKLTVLGQQWDLLTILGQVCGTGTDMTTTREEFTALTHELIGTLGLETLNKHRHVLQFKSQVAVDLLVRSLCERTVDIAFLATDDDVRKFLTRKTDDAGTLAAAREHLATHFDEYLANYSVYSEVILLNSNGQVVCRSDRAETVEVSRDPLLRAVTTSADGYVEHFGSTDLVDDEHERLIYAYRVHQRGPQSPVVGVLALVFRFEDELKAVFDGLLEKHDWTLLALTDNAGVVKASSDALQLPVGTALPVAQPGDAQVVRLGGRAYLAGFHKTSGHQGFESLGWWGCALLPLEHAFSRAAERGRQLAPDHVSLIATNQALFSATLRDIARRADRVQAELDRTVWNGHLPQRDGSGGANVAATKVLLREISSTGGKTKAVFESSIQNLYHTVITSVLDDAGYAAGLAVDVMDRSLYERANDCRWWALTSAFRQILSVNKPSDGECARLAEILGDINGLYTVYSNLVLYNDRGEVIAAAKPGTEELVGTTLQSPEVAQALRQRSQQDYAVSAFEPTPLYDDRPTYVYHAAVRDPHTERTVGGIGVVFDSEPEFKQMLLDTLPVGAGGKPSAGNFMVFVDRAGSVIACSGDEYAPGATLDVSPATLALKNGQGSNTVIEWHGGLYALGARCSGGYREYKSDEDCYTNDVLALTFLRLSPESATIAAPSARPKSARCALRRANEPKVDVATFLVGQLWLGLKAEDVVEAITVNGLTPIPSCPRAVCGVVRYRDTTALIIDPAGPLGYKKRPVQTIEQVVIIRVEGGYVGLVVEELGGVPEVPLASLEPSSTALGKGKVDCVEGIVRPGENDKDASLLLMLRTRPFVDLILGGEAVDALVELGTATANNDSALRSA